MLLPKKKITKSNTKIKWKKLKIFNFGSELLGPQKMETAKSLLWRNNYPQTPLPQKFLKSNKELICWSKEYFSIKYSFELQKIRIEEFCLKVSCLLILVFWVIKQTIIMVLFSLTMIFKFLCFIALGLSSSSKISQQ